MILKIFVNIQDVQWLAVKTCEELLHDNKDVELFGLLALHTVRDILAVCFVGLSGEVRIIHLVIVLDDTFQRVPRVLSLSFAVLVRTVSEDSGDVEVMVDAFEDIIIFDECRYRPYCKQRCVLPVPCL